MEVKEAIKNIKMFNFKNLSRFKPELIDLLKSLESENKKLKKENEAYKGMWRRLYEEIGNHGWELRDQDGFEIMTKIIKELEQKYLGGGE